MFSLCVTNLTFLVLVVCGYRILLYKLTFFVTIVMHVKPLLKKLLIHCNTMDTEIFSLKIYTIR